MKWGLAMDHKTGKVKKKIAKKDLITIVILLIILLLIILGTYLYYRKTTGQILAKQQEASELEPDTAVVKRGPT